MKVHIDDRIVNGRFPFDQDVDVNRAWHPAGFSSADQHLSFLDLCCASVSCVIVAVYHSVKQIYLYINMFTAEDCIELHLSAVLTFPSDTLKVSRGRS